jgi:hypothetical protein
VSVWDCACHNVSNSSFAQDLDKCVLKISAFLKILVSSSKFFWNFKLLLIEFFFPYLIMGNRQ